MHKPSDQRIFSRNVQLELDNLWVTHLMDTDKPIFNY